MDSFAEEKLATVENNGNCGYIEQSDHNELHGNNVHTASTGTSVIGHSGNIGHVMQSVHGGHSDSKNNVQNIYSGPTGAQGRERDGGIENVGKLRIQQSTI